MGGLSALGKPSGCAQNDEASLPGDQNQPDSRAFHGKRAESKNYLRRSKRVEGPVRGIVTDPEYLDVAVPPEEKFFHITVPGYTVFAYIIEGSGHFDREKGACAFEVEGGGRYLDQAEDCIIDKESLVLYGGDGGDSVEVTAGDKGVRFLLISGKPIGEPVAWYGPVVMNTKEELRVAFEEYRQGSFTRYREKRK